MNSTRQLPLGRPRRSKSRRNTKAARPWIAQLAFALAVLNWSAQLPAAELQLAPAAPTPQYPDHSDLQVYLDEAGQPQPIRTADDWAKRRAHIVAGMEQVMGPFPSSQPRILPPADFVGPSHAGSGYVRHLIYLTVEQGDRVPCYLYLPQPPVPAKEPRAAILALHPTSPLGKGVVDGQGPRPNRNYAQELAQRGYVVLAPDYPSFGDYRDYKFAEDRYDSGSMKAIYNHLRCVDYLISRPEVDKERLGVIGHSLGGHNALFAAVIDTRLKAVVSSCGWTPFHDYYQGNLKGWTSDVYMPRIRDVYGSDPNRMPFDFYEVVAAIAPRAFFSCSPLNDSNFDVGGVRKAEAKVGPIFKLLGAESRLVFRYPDSTHDFPVETRRESYEFLDRQLAHRPAAQVP